MRDAFIARLTEHATRDPKIVLITGDLGFGVLTEFAQRFPGQFLNAGDNAALLIEWGGGGGFPAKGIFSGNPPSITSPAASIPKNVRFLSKATSPNTPSWPSF